MRVFEINAIADTLLREVSNHNNDLKKVGDMNTTAELRALIKDPDYKDYIELSKKMASLRTKINNKHGENTVVPPTANHREIIAIRFRNRKWTEYNDKNYIMLRKQEARDLVTIAAMETNVDIMTAIRNKLGLNR